MSKEVQLLQLLQESMYHALKCTQDKDTLKGKGGGMLYIHTS